MKQYWQQFAAKIDTRNQRERMLIFLTALAVTLLLVKTVFFDPLQAKTKALSQEEATQSTQMADLAAKIDAAKAGGLADPDAPLRARLAAAKLALAQSGSALQDTRQTLVAPEKMAHLLEDVLSQNRGLKLVSLKSLPASGVLDKAKQDEPKAGSQPAAAANGSAAAPAIYMHGVEIAVAGSYADLTQYLESVEKLPWHMYWGKAEMHVDEYPRVVLTITLYTLSMEKTWLSV